MIWSCDYGGCRLAFISRPSGTAGLAATDGLGVLDHVCGVMKGFEPWAWDGDD